MLRWRVRGDLESWQSSRFLTIDLPCPPPGKTVFEAQALHSDHEWDATLYSLPILARQHFWQTRLFQWLASAGGLGLLVGLAIVLTRRGSARQMALVKARAALAEERARIARDIHDDLGSTLTRIVLLTELGRREPARILAPDGHLAAIQTAAQEITRRLDEIVWAVNPRNDTLDALVT